MWTQYASKFGKLRSGHRHGKGQFSFQSQRKAMTKNAQTTAQLHSSHTLVKWCSKFSKPGFSNMWTVNFQMFKLVLEKAEEPEIKFPTSTGSWKKQKSSRKTSISALLTMPKPLTVWIIINCVNLFSGLCHFWDHQWCIVVFYYNRNTCFQIFQIPEKWRERKRNKQTKKINMELGKWLKNSPFFLMHNQWVE